MSHRVASGQVSLVNDQFVLDHPRGLYYDENGGIFRYVLAEDAALAVLDVLCYATNYGANDVHQGASVRQQGEVTNTSTSAIDGTLASVNACAGVAMGTVTDNYYGYAQVSGLASAKTDGGVAAGNSLVVDGGNTPNGQFDTAAAGEEHAVAGYALAADVGTTVSCVLRCIL